ncbi:hypothetical protein GCM10009127_08040 [Alteraurantiacibacter aestuarii]|nr:serine hydrolase [Alteraurantiacibacter aestuarii]
MVAAPLSPALADGVDLESNFDSYFGTELRAPRDYSPQYANPLEQQIASLADGSNGRIGVAAVDLSTGQRISVLGDQPFPMASTSKIAIAATYLDMVDQGKLSLSSEFPLMLAVRSTPFSTAAAPVRQGQYMPAIELIDLMITRSSNPATDALLAAVGGVDAVNAWARRAQIEEFRLTRDIATLVRDDGEFDPAVHIDLRDSSTPAAMVELLSGIYQGRWLTPASRSVIIDAMERCRTGTRRIPALMPQDVTVAHKTGSLNNTSSDIGILTAPDGRSIAVAIYVTGQGSRSNREARIASIARAIYDGYTQPSRHYANAEYGESAPGT